MRAALKGAVLFVLLSVGCRSTGAPEGRPVPARGAAQVPARQAEEPKVEREEGPAWEGRPPPAEPEGATKRHARVLTLAATGDLLLHQAVSQAAEAHGWDDVLGGLRRALREEDLAFANLETPLVDDVVPVRSTAPPILGAGEEVAAALASAGLDVLGCANNHAYDQTSAGAARTVDAVEASGMVAVGVARESSAAYGPRVVVEDGVRVAFLSYTEMLNQGPDDDPARAYVARLRNEALLRRGLAEARGLADVVVMAVHWGRDYREEPQPYHRELAAWLVEHGVDVILGTGTHLLHRVERVPSARGDAVVAYSLGNLVSNQGQLYRVGQRLPAMADEVLGHPGTRDGVVLRVQLEVDRGVRVVALSAIPLWTENNGWERKTGRTDDLVLRVRTLASLDPATRKERTETIRAALGPLVRLVSAPREEPPRMAERASVP